MLKILIITPKILYDAEKLCDDLKQNYSVQPVTCTKKIIPMNCYHGPLRPDHHV